MPQAPKPINIIAQVLLDAPRPEPCPIPPSPPPQPRAVAPPAGDLGPEIAGYLDALQRDDPASAEALHKNLSGQ